MLTSIKCMEELLYREMRDKKWSETGISQWEKQEMAKWDSYCI